MAKPIILPTAWRPEPGIALPTKLWSRRDLGFVLLALSTVAWPILVQSQVPDAKAAKVQQEIIRGLSRLREAGCQGQPGKPALAAVDALHAAAQSVANGAQLGDALTASNYRATKANTVRLGGHVSSAAVLKAVVEGYCEVLMDTRLSELGVDVRGRQYAIIFAAPFQPTVIDRDQVRAQALVLTNDARSRGAVCGDKSFAPVGPLTASVGLDRAALGHAKDMAEHSYFSHTGRDGKKPAERITAAGYRWTTAGENIASGQDSVQEAVAGWIKSPGHCANLMNPGYREMGIAAAVNAKSEGGIYWVQTFGAP